jgi:peptide/nickel transport system substrate-binding protein
MHLTRRTALAGSLTLGLASPAGLVRARPRRTVLRFVPEFELRGMDPIVNTGLVTLQHGYMVYDTLFAMDRSFTPRPQMVDHYELSADRLTYDFRLRDGLRFHDGTAVGARDCVASIRRWAERDVMGRMLIARTQTLSVIDDKSFRISLATPFPPTLVALGKISSSPCFIMREREAASDPYRGVTEVVGSGPFRFLPDSYVPGSLAVYAANTAYVARTDPADGYAGAKRAGVHQVEWHIIPDAATQVDAIRAGEVDIIPTPSTDLLPLLRRDPAIAIDQTDRQDWLAYIRPNHLYPPFDDVRARQALALLVDQTEYMQAGVGGPDRWQFCWSFMACGETPRDAAAADTGSGRPDLPRARQLLQAAGYRGEPIVVLDPADNIMIGNITAVTISQLRKIGVTVQPRTVDLATMLAMRAITKPPGEGGWHLFHGRSLDVELSNPLTNFPLASPCTADESGDRAGWFGWPCDPAIERLRLQWADAADEAERQRIAGLLQDAAARSLPFIPLGQIDLPLVRRKAVRGLIDMPVPVLWNATLA